MVRVILSSLLLMLLITGPARADAGDYVVLLHGIGRTNSSMLEMAQALARDGYHVVNIDYASRDKSIEDILPDVQAAIKDAQMPANAQLNFIGHSMGGLVARAYIAKYKPRHLGRVVQLGTPNGGSAVADMFHDSWWYQKFYGPAGQELITDQAAFKKVFGKIDYELGVIAGDRSIDPISSLLIIPGKDDGKVSVEGTKIEGMKDHIVLHVTHTFMPSNDGVIAEAEYFLAHGVFLPPSK